MAIFCIDCIFSVEFSDHEYDRTASDYFTDNMVFPKVNLLVLKLLMAKKADDKLMIFIYFLFYLFFMPPSAKGSEAYSISP